MVKKYVKSVLFAASVVCVMQFFSCSGMSYIRTWSPVAGKTAGNTVINALSLPVLYGAWASVMCLDEYIRAKINKSNVHAGLEFTAIMGITSGALLWYLQRQALALTNSISSDLALSASAAAKTGVFLMAAGFAGISYNNNLTVKRYGGTLPKSEQSEIEKLEAQKRGLDAQTEVLTKKDERLKNDSDLSFPHEEELEGLINRSAKLQNTVHSIRGWHEVGYPFIGMGIGALCVLQGAQFIKVSYGA